MSRKCLAGLTVLSLLLGVGAFLLWDRGVSGVDEAMLRYDRYLANGLAASDSVYLTSDKRLWLTINSGSVAPFNGQLVWGYHVNANQSKGKPRFDYNRDTYATTPFSSNGRLAKDDRAMSGWGPFRWQDFRRAGGGEQFRSVTIGMSHWLVTLLFLALPMQRLRLIHRLIKRTVTTDMDGEQSNAPGATVRLFRQWSPGTHFALLDKPAVAPGVLQLPKQISRF